MQPLQEMQIRDDPKKGLQDVRSFLGACNFYRRHIHSFTYSSACTAVTAVEEEVASREDSGAPAAGGNRMAGVRTEAVTRAKDGRTTGG